MAMNSLTQDDIALLRKCELRSPTGVHSKALAMNPNIMPFVPRILTRKDDITVYTRRVLQGVKESEKIKLNAQEENEPSEERIYLAYNKHKVQAKVKEFIAKTTSDWDEEFFVGCPVRFLENRYVAEGVVNGAIGKLKGISERGKHPTIQLKNGKAYTLTRSSASIYVDESTTYERHMIQSGRLRADPGRPVAKFTYSYYRLKMALAMMPYACQGCTMDTANIHPNVEYDNAYTVIECVYVALSRLRSSGVDKPDKPETTSRAETHDVAL